MTATTPTRVSITFDNGPTVGVTGQVLDVLAKHEVYSTFFVLGRKLGTPAERALVERAHAEGHWIGNHTFTHAAALGDSIDPDTPAAEIGRTQELLAHVAHDDRLFRPPGGGGKLDHHLLSRTAVQYLEDGKYTTVLWNNVPRDWSDPDGWETTCRRGIARQRWSVVVLHDVDTGAMRHLDAALGRMRDDALDLVQDYPDDCVPVRRGRVMSSIEHLVAN
jgi:peptidoglycan/xylan/chitin deacetylase (PgdA/CDA1 family)